MKVDMTIPFDRVLDLVKESIDSNLTPIFNQHRQEVAELRAENENLKARLSAILNAEPARMTTPIGLLPINSTGMRALVDNLAYYMEGDNYELSAEVDQFAALFDVNIFDKHGDMRRLPEVLNEIAAKWKQREEVTTYGGRPIENYASLIFDEPTWRQVESTLKPSYCINVLPSVVDVPYRILCFDLTNTDNGRSVTIQVKVDISKRVFS